MCDEVCSCLCQGLADQSAPLSQMYLDRTQTDELDSMLGSEESADMGQRSRLARIREQISHEEVAVHSLLEELTVKDEHLKTLRQTLKAVRTDYHPVIIYPYFSTLDDITQSLPTLDVAIAMSSSSCLHITTSC